MDFQELDPQIYSPQARFIKKPEGDGYEAVPITWKELYEDRLEEVARLRGFQKIISDLDRNEHGRHEGDIDVGDPTGVSQGNPLLKTGQVIGYNIGGQPYIMPERDKRNNPNSWGNVE